MKLLVLAALIGAAVAAPVEYRCVKPEGNKYGAAHQSKCSKFKDSASCLAYKFRNGAKCQWKKGKIVTVTEYFSVKPLPTYTNNAKPSAIVQRKEVEYDVRKWSTLEYQNLEEMEYHGEMEAEANMAGSLVDSTEPCPRTLVRDCDGQCAPAFWIGNGLCDNGGKAKVGATKSCKAVVAAQCEKRCKNGVDGKWWTKKGATKNAADAYLMKECTKKCNAATGMKDRVMKWSGCTWIMPKLADYGVAKHHGVYNFNCPQFWNDGGDCLSEARIVNRRAWYRHFQFKRKALKMALNTIKSSSAASVSVVAMAAMAAVAAVAMVAKKARGL